MKRKREKGGPPITANVKGTLLLRGTGHEPCDKEKKEGGAYGLSPQKREKKKEELVAGEKKKENLDLSTTQGPRRGREKKKEKGTGLCKRRKEAVYPPCPSWKKPALSTLP